MAKGVYVGVNNTADKVKKIYIGVGGVAKKIKKAYVGINDVARLCWSGGTLTYYGLAKTPFPNGRIHYAGASIGDYALFAGGEVSAVYKTAFAYNKNLTYTNAPSLQLGQAGLSASNIGDYALFVATYADAYDANLTKTIAPNTRVSKSNSYKNAGASIGNYALFAGGYNGNNESAINYVEAYDGNLVRTNAPNGVSTYNLAGASNNNYALFAGGQNDNLYLIDVKAYNKNLTTTNASSLNNRRTRLAGGAIGKYVVFAGGSYGITSYATVDAYDEYLTKTTCEPLSQAKEQLASSTLEEYLMFAGGYCNPNSSSSTILNTVDVYDENLTKTIIDSLAVARYGLASAVVGDYVLFGSGKGKSVNHQGVDIYTIA